MHVAFVTPFYKPHYGGIERFIDSVGHGLVTAGSAKVSVVTTASTYTERLAEVEEPRFDDRGIAVVRLQSYLRDPHTYGHPVSVGLLVPGLRAALDELDPDLVHLTNGGWYLPNLEAALAAGGRRVGISPFHHRLRPTLGNLPQMVVNAALFRRLDFVHAVTSAEAQAIATTYRLPSEKTRVIPLGVPRGSGAPPFESRDCVLHVGRISRYKGSLLAAQAFLETVASLPPRMRFVVVGHDGGQRAQVEHAFAAAGASDRLEIHSRIDDGALSALYERAIALLLPSKDEAFAYVIFEALSHGCPAIVSDLPALRELLPEGARFVPGGQAADFSAALRKLLANPEDWRRSSERGPKLVSSRYSLDFTVNEFKGLYKGLVP